MPQPPPKNQRWLCPSPEERHKSQIKSLKLHKCGVTSSIHCYTVIFISNSIILLLLQTFLVSNANAAIAHNQPSYKPYLARTKYSDESGRETWTRTGVRFLTKVKTSEENGVTRNGYDAESGQSAEISASDFHIIELGAEGSHDDAETLRIHLTRKSSVVHPHFRVVVRNEEQEDTWSPSNITAAGESGANCHYVGHVTATPSNTDKFNGNQHSKKSGLAVFSACPPSNGFSGLIIMEDGRQWYIEPSADASRQMRWKRDTYSSEQESLEHVLIPHSQLAGHLAAHVSDVLRVPLPQLEEAARLAAADAEARRNIRHVNSGIAARGWDDDDDIFEGLQGESSILTPFFYSGATLPFFDRSGNRKTHPRKVASSPKKTANSGEKSSVQTTLLTPLENGSGVRRASTSTTTTTSTSSSSSITSTTTRETASSALSSASVENLSGQARPLPRVVEIAVFTDEELYNKMKAKFNSDTTAQLKEYATAMVNMMDVMYQHASLGVDLRFKLVYLEVMKKKPNPLKTHGGKAKAYLSSFCDYAGEKNVNSAQWDHALLLTGLDLHEEGVKTTAGLAWAGTMCFRYYSCSISEGLNFASAYITTHEIGHSLGMEHDGVGVSSACDSTKYIMSPTTGPGKVTWSTCSANNLQDFIKYGTSELRGKAAKGNFISRPVCLEETVSNRGKKSFEVENIKSGGSSDESVLEAESDLKLPGEKYDANYQCSLGMGSFFKPHFERHKPPFDNICWILYCGNGTHAISTHPALEGTPCDRKKYCRAGQCVKRPDSSSG